MDINELAGVDISALNPSRAVGGNQDLGKDTFLKLLTTQMQNQDPTSPMDNQAFIQQMTQFASLEQLMSLQTSMDNVYMATASMNNASMSNLLGREVVGRGDVQNYDGKGDMDFNWASGEQVSELSISVLDDSGKTVATFRVPGGCEAGEGNFTWNGKKGVIGGGRLPEGDYQFRVNGTDQEGNVVAMEEWVRGVVTEMDYSTSIPQPAINGVPIDLASIVRLSLAPTDGET
jgi:flagellar basal-body rod modification protein FlgD